MPHMRGVAGEAGEAEGGVEIGQRARGRQRCCVCASGRAVTTGQTMWQSNT